MRNRSQPGYPSTPQQMRLCREYIKDYSVVEAAKRAGYSNYRAEKSCHGLIKQFAPYIKQLQAKKSEVVAAKIAINQEDILQSLARVVFHDPRQFKTTAKVGKRQVERLKGLDELTLEQAQVISEMWEEGGRIHYKLEDRAHARQLLGKHLGLFHDKLIAEHRHAHLHAMIDLKGVSDEQLAQAEGELMRILGPHASRILGYTRVAEEGQEHE